MYKVIQSEKAEQDFENIIEYIAKDNPYKALSFTQEMIDSFASLVSTFPRAGQKYKNCYLYVYQGYYIFYDIKDDTQTVELLRAVNAAQYTAYKNFL